MPRLLVPALLLSLGACVEEESEALSVLIPDDLVLLWDGSFNGVDDGIAAVVPVDVMVYEAETGEPMEAVTLELWSDASAALVVDVTDVVLVEFEACDDCALTWDAYRDRYVALEADEASGGLTLTTDVDGIARAYVVVDAFPVDDGQVAPIVVRVAMGADEDAFLLTAR